MRAFNIQQPEFSKEKVIELGRIILRIISPQDCYHRVIWIEGDDQAGKTSFANYINYLLRPETREAALNAIKKINSEAISEVDIEELMLLRSYRGGYDIKELQLFDLLESEDIAPRDNTIYSFYESSNQKMDVQDDGALMRFIDKVSSCNNSWLIWLSNRSSYLFEESEDDRRAIKIRDHESCSVIRLRKNTDF